MSSKKVKSLAKSVLDEQTKRVMSLKKFKDIPRSIKVLANVYTIEVVTTNKEIGDHQGLCYTTDKRILINGDYVNENVSDTLMHEILHAIWKEMNLRGERIEEKIVHILTTGWTTVMIDNPPLRKYFNEQWGSYTFSPNKYQKKD